MKKLLITLLLFTSFSTSKATIHEILVWDGYYQFMPSQLEVMLGDTIQWSPLDFPSMMHTITSDDIPPGAEEFDYIYQAPADTFFQYVPEFVGVYDYVCTPHISFGMVASFTVNGPLDLLEHEALDYSLFPNPCKKSQGLNLQLDQFESNDEFTFTLRSVEGKIVRQMEINAINSTIPINDLEAGVYVAIINRSDTRIKSSKLIIVDN